MIRASRCADLLIKSIKLENYRNLENMEFFPSEGINIIYGDNAQGKTNLLECIWLFTGGRSFRGSKDSELISFGEKFSRVSLCFETAVREQSIVIMISGGKREAILNDVPKKYMSQIIGSFCAVIFSPDHLSLIKSGPEERRNFIDAALCQIKPSYAILLSRYKRMLNERNALLKDIPKHRELEDMLDIWDDRLVNEGTRIAVERQEYVSCLSKLAEGFYDGISAGRERLSLSYKTGCCKNGESDPDIIKEDMLSSLLQRRTDDIYCGFTTTGVHRDDLSVRINGKEAKSFGSQGQQRSAVLAMKLAEAAVAGEKKGEKPVILLDDVLSELDMKRRSYLLNRLDGMQVFITCCDKAESSETKFRMENGKLSRTEV